MRALFFLMLVSFLSGCAVQQGQSYNVSQMQEKYEFTIVNQGVALKRSSEFVLDVYSRHKKALFEIHYQPDASELTDLLIARMKKEGINPDSIKAIVRTEPSEKQVSIYSSYVLLREKDCGTLRMLDSQYYPFGCSLEYNRMQMLSNPEKLIR